MSERTFWRKATINGTPALIPAEQRTEQIFATYRNGETRGGKLTMPRNLGFHRLAHSIGGLAADNLDDFDGMGAHECLKRLQLETGVECDEMAIRIGKQMVIHRVPRSLSFDSMGQDRFKKLVTAICERLIRGYGFGESEDEIRQMADEYMRA